MSLHYVIDAFNLINRTSLAQKPDPIKNLIEFIHNQRPQGSIKNKVTLVFDGYPKLDFRFKPSGNLEIIFSRELSADEVIKNILAQKSSDKNLMVVSDDREVTDAARFQHIQFTSTADFIGKSNNKNSPKRLLDDKNISYSDMAKINKELKEIWIKNAEKERK